MIKQTQNGWKYTQYQWVGGNAHNQDCHHIQQMKSLDKITDGVLFSNGIPPMGRAQ